MKKNVLVIDDDLNTLSFISLVLEQEGYEVLATSDIQEGLTYCNSTRPAVIILDLEMPEMHGLEVLKRLEPGIEKDFSVIILTGYGHDAFIKACYDLGVYAFISKPVRIVELKGLVRNALLWEDYKQSLFEHKQQIEKLVQERTETLMQEIELRKQIEQQLMQANQIKERILNILSWDLRSPLSNLVMNLRYLLDNAKAFPESILQQLSDTYTEARNTWQLTENIFLWSRCEKGEIENHPEICNLHSVIKDSILFFSNSANSKKIKLKAEIDDKIEIYADRKIAYSIIQNVLSNAIKYSHPDGTIDIKATIEGKRVSMLISDKGVGISEAVLNDLMNIAKPISTPGTANEKGSGLGLTISKKLADIISAEIHIASKNKVGTTVTIHFPTA
ncbi:MAG: hybrid sensor histidine kinase/response regulator [Candidatus Cloacimonadaceae bacterium]